MLRKLYESMVPSELRLQFFKLRNPSHFRKLRSHVYHSAKGDFSLRAFDRFQCIFVHITRTAGTSVAKNLFGELPYHYTSTQYRVFFGRRDFNRYFKFAFVRNPWDRLHSAFHYLKGGGWDDNDRRWADRNLGTIDDFKGFVIDWLTPERLQSHIHFWPQTQFICGRRGNCLVDHLGYFESIEEDFAAVAKRLGVNAVLTHENSSQRTDYKSAYDAASVARVSELYKRDVQALGYTFGHFQRKRIDEGQFIKE